VSPVKYELVFYISEYDILHSENLKYYIHIMFPDDEGFATETFNVESEPNYDVWTHFCDCQSKTLKKALYEELFSCFPFMLHVPHMKRGFNDSHIVACVLACHLVMARTHRLPSKIVCIRAGSETREKGSVCTLLRWATVP
jgi:hypothetical protein